MVTTHTPAQLQNKIKTSPPTTIWPHLPILKLLAGAACAVAGQGAAVLQTEATIMPNHAVLRISAASTTTTSPCPSLVSAEAAVAGTASNDKYAVLPWIIAVNELYTLGISTVGYMQCDTNKALTMPIQSSGVNVLRIRFRAAVLPLVSYPREHLLKTLYEYLICREVSSL